MRVYRAVAAEDRIRLTPEQRVMEDAITMQRCTEQVEFLLVRKDFLQRKLKGVMTDTDLRRYGAGLKHTNLQLLHNTATMADLEVFADEL